MVAEFVRRWLLSTIWKSTHCVSFQITPRYEGHIEGNLALMKTGATSDKSKG